jgi:hypothetical protein
MLLKGLIFLKTSSGGGGGGGPPGGGDDHQNEKAWILLVQDQYFL